MCPSVIGVLMIHSCMQETEASNHSADEAGVSVHQQQTDIFRLLRGERETHDTSAALDGD